MASVSTFFTPYSALRGTDRVEAIAIIVTEAPGREPEHLYVVLDELGVSSLARPDQLTLCGVTEESTDVDDVGAHPSE